MGALGVLMAIGLFEVDGGAAQRPVYDITSPLFDEVIIHLDNRYYNGKTFRILTQNNSAENMYIQNAWLNGKLWNSFQFYHDTFIQGGELILELGPNPNKKWGIEKLK